jgi:hypothetical protein
MDTVADYEAPEVFYWLEKGGKTVP